MTDRRELLEALSVRMEGLPASERTRLVAYFEDMIDDRLAAGMDEAAAVSALGDVDALLRDALPEMRPGIDQTGAAHCDEPVREIHIHLKNADAVLRREPLPGGMTAQINASEGGRFTWHLAEGVLSIGEVAEARRRLFRPDAKLEVILPEMNPDALIADSYGGDIEVEGIVPGERAVLASSSGDIRLKEFGCRGRLEITVRSGDIELNKVEAAADCKLESVSGDIGLREVRAASLRVRTASGDVEGRAIRADAIALGATSGDIEMEDVEAGGTLLCETTAGDVEMIRAAAAEVRASSKSGDIRLALSHRPGGYAIRAASAGGDVRVSGDDPDGGAQVLAQSADGDIHVSVE